MTMRGTASTGEIGAAVAGSLELLGGSAALGEAVGLAMLCDGGRNKGATRDWANLIV